MRGISAALALVLLLGAGVALAKEKDKLPQRYREWLDKDVVYIISKEEHDAFLRLARDEDRDKFIEEFWEIRNPTPGAPTNPFREEHYRRIQHANDHFSTGSGTDGWRADRGRVYILLGPPQQRAFYLGLQKVRPMEIWFYSASDPALPPFFYLVFYQRENIGDFRLYSPYFDGPEKLITTTRAVNNRVAALRIIDKEAGREVARTTLSLLPDEPVDMQTATSSLQSDLLVATIRNLANHPLSKASLEYGRRMLESVTSRLIVGGETLQALAVPLRDPDGTTRLHYALRLQRPEDFALAQTDDGRYYYSIAVTARVSTRDGKLILSQEKVLSHYFRKEELDRIRNKAFGYEGWLPLPPGQYKLEFLLTNQLKSVVFRAEKEVVVPEVPSEGIRLTDLVPFFAAETVDPTLSAALPFSVAGVRFTPHVGKELILAQGQDLEIFYQVWGPPTDPRQFVNKKLSAEYVFGRPGARGDFKTVREEISREQFDAAGSLLSGKRLSLADAIPGNYRLTVTLVDLENQQRTYATLGFRVGAAGASPHPWDVYDSQSLEDIRQGVTDFQRGLCYLALGQQERATQSFQRALQKNPGHEEARAKLVDSYFARQEFSAVASLYARAGITNQTKDQTILRMAESLEKTGDTKKAIGLLESAVAIKTDSGPLYLALASSYQRSGELQKAAELERKAKALMPPPTLP